MPLLRLALPRKFKAERAWLTFAKIETTNLRDFNLEDVPYKNVVAFNVSWINSGRTPALKTNVYIARKICKLGSGVPVFGSVPLSESTNRRATIGANVAVGSAPAYVAGKEFDELMAKRAIVFVYSRAEYVEVFNPNTERVSEVCFGITYKAELITENDTREPVFDMIPMGDQNTCT
jgi:hypothetical protein